MKYQMLYALAFILFPIIVFADIDLREIKSSWHQADECQQIVFNELPDEMRSIDEESQVMPRLLPIPQDLPITDMAEIIATFTIALETKQPLVPSPSPTLSFQALDDSLTVIPPDTMGAAGLTQLMTTLNDRVRVQTKTGAELRTVTLAGFWGLTNSTPFDPRLTYDSFNNRWIFVTVIDPFKPTSMILTAVSQTDDALGSWNIYRIKTDPTATATSGVWADFPTLGFNSKWIVVQVNAFNIADGGFNSSRIYVFNKADLYANGPGNYRLFTLTGFGATQTPAITYDNANPNLYFLQNWNGNAFGLGFLRLYVLSGPVGAESLTTPGLIGIPSPWASFHPIINGGFAPQLGTSIRIMNNDARMLSVVFRNGSIWAAQTAFLPASSPTHSVAQWMQISPTGTVQQFGRVQDPNATLNSGTFYAFPSISVNALNDVILGYSFFSPQIYASSGYSFRHAADPLNTMGSPALLRSGQAMYTKDFGSGEVRWGDYSNSITDPLGNGFWTIQESADSLYFGTSRWVTWWGLIGMVATSTCVCS